MKREYEIVDRREFLQFLGKSAALAGLAGTASSAPAATTASQNPFAYDVTRLEKTDPKLISHVETSRWKCPHKETKRLSIGPDNRLYLCAGNYLTALNVEGKTEQDIAFAEPVRCAAAQNGKLYVGLRDHVEVFDAQGHKLATWGSAGKKSWLTGLAIAGNGVFAADSGSRLILRYDLSGKLLRKIGEKDADRNVPGFVVPSPYLDLEIHRDGLLRVNNPGLHQVELYTFDGDFEGAWGKPTAAIEGFCGCCNPIALSSFSDGRVLTCEKGLPRVKIYDADGQFDSVVAGTESFAENARACPDLNDCTRGGLDAAVDSRGRIFVLDLVTSEVRVFQAKG